MIYLFLLCLYSVGRGNFTFTFTRLREFENKVVRKIFGYLRDEKKGQELQDLFSLEDPVWVIKISKMT